MMPGMALDKARWVDNRARTLAFWSLAVLVAASIGVLVAANPAHAATTFAVNSTADTQDANLANTVCDVNASVSGNQCTLRAAIQESNNTSGADTIRFNIVAGTSSVKTISPASALPTIREAVTINGYTQSGASANTLATGNNAVLKVQLNGTNAGTNADGLAITSSNSIIKGLVINRFKGNKRSAGNGVLISGTGATGNKVQGNFIGTTSDGSAALGNSRNGVFINGAPTNTVGGTASGAPNVISGNVGRGVSIIGTEATGNKVLGNFIGTTPTGAPPWPIASVCSSLMRPTPPSARRKLGRAT